MRVHKFDPHGIDGVVSVAEQGELQALVGRTQPAQVAVLLLKIAGFSREEIAQRFINVSFQEIAVTLRTRLAAHLQFKADIDPCWLKPWEANFSKSLCELYSSLASSPRFQACFAPVWTIEVGLLSIGDFLHKSQPPTDDDEDAARQENPPPRSAGAPGSHTEELAHWIWTVYGLPWVAQMRQDDATAFEQFHRHCSSVLSGYIGARTHQKAETDEVVQNTCVRLWQDRLRTYDPAWGSLHSYLRQIAAWELADYYRSQKKYRSLFAVITDLVAEADGLSYADLLDKLAAMSIQLASDQALHAIPFELVLTIDRLIFAAEGSPHQPVTAAYVRQLGWKPKLLVMQRADLPFNELVNCLADDMSKQNRPQAHIDTCLAPLRQWLRDRLTLQAVLDLQKVAAAALPPSEKHAALQTLQDAQDFYRHLLARVIADTTLRDYGSDPSPAKRQKFNDDPNKMLADDARIWWSSMKRRVLKRLGRGTIGELGESLDQC